MRAGAASLKYLITTQPKYSCLLPAVAMMLGWGLRGFIGGGPFGAMIPGAMVILSLGIFYPRRHLSLLAAYAAIGVGFGGEMTYGQTVGFIVQAETFWWGALGLALKGAIWGALAGPVIVLGFRTTPRDTTVAVLLLVAATQLGWHFINQPKLIYFSNLLDKPRPEIWAGLLLAALTLTAYLQSKLAWRFLLAGLLGGGIGFGVGGAIQGLGRILTPDLNLHWWKYMEFFFGFCFGWALAWAFAHSEVPEDEPVAHPGVLVQVLAASAAMAWLFYANQWLPLRYGYLAAASPVLVAVTTFPWLAKHVAYSVTFCAFALDLARHWGRDYQRGAPEPAYLLAILASLSFAWLTCKYHADTRRMLTLFTWAGVIVATLKFAIHPTGLIALVDHVAVLFVLMAVWITWAIRRSAVQPFAPAG